jgi:hypothetical protein
MRAFGSVMSARRWLKAQCWLTLVTCKSDLRSQAYWKPREACIRGLEDE